jgi:hypothetical protein
MKKTPWSNFASPHSQSSAVLSPWDDYLALCERSNQPECGCRRSCTPTSSTTAALCLPHLCRKQHNGQISETHTDTDTRTHTHTHTQTHWVVRGDKVLYSHIVQDCSPLSAASASGVRRLALWVIYTYVCLFIFMYTYIHIHSFIYIH